MGAVACGGGGGGGGRSLTKLATPLPNLELVTAAELPWDAADNPAPLLLISHFMVLAEDTLLHLLLKHRMKIKI